MGWPKLWTESQREWAMKRLLRLKFGCWGVREGDPIGWCSEHACYVDHCPELPPAPSEDTNAP